MIIIMIIMIIIVILIIIVIVIIHQLDVLVIRHPVFYLPHAETLRDGTIVCDYEWQGVELT